MKKKKKKLYKRKLYNNNNSNNNNNTNNNNNNNKIDYYIFINKLYLKNTPDSFKKGNGTKIDIKNDQENFYNLPSVIEEHLYDDELILFFPDSYYDMTKVEGDIIFYVYTNITIKGNIEGTIFDYKNEMVWGLLIEFIEVNTSFIFENILIKNFGNEETDSYAIPVLDIYTNFSNITFIINNCNFQNNYNTVLLVDMIDPCFYYNDCYDKTGLMKDEPFMIINNTTFYNNNRSMYLFNIYVDYDILVEFNDCTIDSNVEFLYSDFASFFTFNNCYITGVVNGDNHDNYASFLHSSGYDTLTINNSKIENLYLKNHNPLIESNALSLNIINTTISNCYSDYDYLIKINENMNFNVKFTEYNEGYVTIENSVIKNTFNIFTGKYCNFYIKKTTFSDIIKNKSYYPAISNFKNSEITIIDSKFLNLELVSSLFNKDSTYKFINVNLKDINTNFEALFYFNGLETYINNMTIENVRCSGDGGDSSLFLLNYYKYDSDFNYNTLVKINDLKIINSRSNGPIIKIDGYYNDITITNSTFQSITSYGAIIHNESKVTLNITNVNFINNKNINKYDCGLLHFSGDDTKLSIENSLFENNESKSNGGAICFNDITNMELNLNSNLFNNNKAVNGGALSFEDNKGIIKNNINYRKRRKRNEIIENDNSLNNIIINMENNIFEKNQAENYGGAIYSNYNSINSYINKNNKIKYNEAGIMGGGIYSKNIWNNSKCIFIFDHSSDFQENISNNHLNNYSSKPSYISLDNKIKGNKISLYSGDLLPLSFSLYDEYDNIVEDKAKFLSYVMLTLSLKEKYSNSTTSTNNITRRNNINEKYNTSENINKNIIVDNNTDDIGLIKKINTKLLGNVSSLMGGHFKFNDFKIIGNANTYILNLSINDYNEDVIFKIPEIEITINQGCSENYIKFYDKNDFLSCEIPKCFSSCPVDITAECIANTTIINKNDPHLNKCQCLPGWTGSLCNEKVFINFSGVKKFTNMILKYSTYMNYSECSLNFLFKHIGSSAVIFFYYTFISQGFILGVKVLKKGKNNKYELDDESSLGFEVCGNEIRIIIEEDDNIYNNNDNDSYDGKEGAIMKSKNDKKKSVMITNYYGSVSFSTIDQNNINSFEYFNYIINKSEKRVHSEFIEATLIYIAYFILLLILIIFFKMQNIMRSKNIMDYRLVKDTNNDWPNSKCKLISYSFLDNQRYAKVKFEKADDPSVYFKYKNMNNIEITRENYIQVYKKSSTIIGKKYFILN
ncbi:hypothetical protein BCR32DRAFT_291039 [Anaeromyces robustus]|uniref:EGF-like domain-containing protein n=1 Tax=Anaeromyces robustus TaxID=1754192 RepID=A0A1Y1XGJ1_9FUNG|nr:hypothetical protein BCR32DRAFT_291039 [Anaeromyces robustus]|eukprot:ORX84871.1 hypothetical protein BCR32DRAFT_291039 [Anaeromyces robustus]